MRPGNGPIENNSALAPDFHIAFCMDFQILFEVSIETSADLRARNLKTHSLPRDRDVAVSVRTLYGSCSMYAAEEVTVLHSNHKFLE